MEVCGIVYSLTCKLNGKQYVGQTTQSVEKRFKEHARNKKSYIGKAIRAYGEDKFVIAILKVCFSKEELDHWEKFFIVLLNTKAPRGYNLTDGGEGIVGYNFTTEHRAKISAARKGKALSPEHRASIGAKVRGKNNGFFGKHHTDETRAIMAEIHRIETPYKNLLNELNKRNMLYADLAVFLGISPSTLSEKMHGNRNFTARDAEKLKNFFGLPIEYLLQRDDGAEATLSNCGVSPYKNLTAELELRKMSYTALAKLMGLGLASVSNKMRGKTRFTEKDKKKLAEIFGKPVEYLLQRDD